MENLRFFFLRIFGGIGGEAPDQGHGGVSLNEVKSTLCVSLLILKCTKLFIY
jgi:hypothetical protein